MECAIEQLNLHELWPERSMAKSPFEVPNEMRDLAERSVDQARKAFEGFVAVAQKTAGAMEGATTSAQTSAKSVTLQMLGFAEQNVNAAFDLAERLVQAKDAQEAFALQAAFIQKQFEALKSQAAALSGVRKESEKP